MRLAFWDTREAPDPGFGDNWQNALANATHTHFGFDPRYLSWEAEHGRHSIAALIEQGARCGAIVLRRVRGAWRSGWPWRWQMVMTDSPRADAVGLGPEDVEWFYRHSRWLSGSSRIEYFAPGASTQAGAFYPAGGTTVRSLAMSDAALLQSLDTNKRRAIKRATREGYVVVEATSAEEMRAFARLQAETERRRGVVAPTEVADPAPGEAWREWEHPWMWLLLAVREGMIEAGSGFGRYPGGMIDYRANGSSVEAKRLGANALLAFEAMRRARDLGHRWMNWGGVTTFKRELGGERVNIYCRLGGGRRWAVPNYVVSKMRGARPVLAAWQPLRALRSVALPARGE